MQVFNRIRLAFKLPIIMSLLVAIAVAVTATVGFQRANHAAVESARTQLASVAHLTGRRVQALLDAIGRELEVQADSTMAADALRDFTRSFDALDDPLAELTEAFITSNPHPVGERDKLLRAKTGTLYDAVHARYHASYDRLQNSAGYYDVFLITPGGDVVYSVFKESDYATNLNSGQWKDTGLARAFRGAMEAGPDGMAFDDFAPYGPSADAPAAFVARRVYDGGGQVLGVLAFQMPIENLNGTTQNLTGLRDSAAAYIVGPNGYLRSDLEDTPEVDILVRRMDDVAVTAALAGEAGLAEIPGVTGEPALAAYEPVDAFGTRWAVVTVESQASILSSVTALRNAFVLIGLGVTAVALLVSALLSSSISRPIDRVRRAMSAIRGKDFSHEVPATGRGDEIGEMARTLEGFRDELARADELAREAAFKGNAFEKSGSAMMMVNEKLELIYANDAVVDMLNTASTGFESLAGTRKPGDLVGLGIDRVHPGLSEYRNILGDPARLPHRLVLPVGHSFFEVDLNAVLDEDGKQIGALLEWRNQTKSVRDGAMIAALDSSSIRIEVGKDGKVRWANDNAVRVLGVSRQEAIGRPIDTLVEPDPGASAPIAALSEIVRASSAADGAMRITGKPILLEGQITPMTDPFGTPAGIVLIAQNVTTERSAARRAEAAREEAEADQAQVVEALGDGLVRLSEGDLTCQIDTPFSESYELLRENFNAATLKLRDAIVSIFDSASSMRGDTEQISTAAQDLSRRTEAQAATLEQTASELDHITTSVQSSAESARSAADSVARTRDDVETSGSVVHDAITAMGEIESFSKKIATIIGVIDQIAFQTNLLALNAGVEAARAGDAGRGFAVVASEVRALAQNSSQAAREINGLITSSSAQIESGVSLVSATGEFLERIMASVSAISEDIRAIASSSGEQSAGLQKINEAVTKLDQVTQQNAAMFEQTSASTVALAQEAGGLMSGIRQFRVGAHSEMQGDVRAGS